MRRREFLACASCIPAFAQKKPGRAGPPEILLLVASARAEDGRVNLDGRIRNSGDREVRKLTIFFELLDSDRNVLTRQQGPIEPEVLQPGDEAEFHVQMAYHARAVWFRTEFEDGGGREIKAKNTGPFPIE